LKFRVINARLDRELFSASKTPEIIDDIAVYMQIALVPYVGIPASRAFDLVFHEYHLAVVNSST